MGGVKALLCLWRVGVGGSALWSCFILAFPSDYVEAGYKGAFPGFVFWELDLLGISEFLRQCVARQERGIPTASVTY